MTIKYNSPGANFTSLKNAWNQNKFMKEYEQVNNPYFPFVYGNPDGYGSNTNPDPFFWGQPQAPKYCACGSSLKLAQAGEGYCSSCNGDATYKDNSQPVSAHLSESSKTSPSDNEDWNNDSALPHLANAIQNNTVKTLENNLDDPSKQQTISNGHVQQRKQLRTLQSIGAASLPTKCRINPNSPGCITEFYTPSQLPYNSVSQYGRGSVGNGTIPNAPVVPVSYYIDEQYSQPNQPNQLNQSPVMIGQYPPVKITSMGGIDYSYESPVNVASNWSPQQRKDFCSSTRGGKKLAF